MLGISVHASVNRDWPVCSSSSICVISTKRVERRVHTHWNFFFFHFATWTLLSIVTISRLSLLFVVPYRTDTTVYDKNIWLFVWLHISNYSGQRQPCTYSTCALLLWLWVYVCMCSMLLAVVSSKVQTFLSIIYSSPGTVTKKRTEIQKWTRWPRTEVHAYPCQ